MSLAHYVYLPSIAVVIESTLLCSTVLRKILIFSSFLTNILQTQGRRPLLLRKVGEAYQTEKEEDRGDIQ